MNKTTEIKESIFNQLVKIIDERIEIVKRAIASAKESRDNETKSSVGDKYETGHAMMQMELEKNQVQLHKALNLKHELSQINLNKNYNKVEFGSLVITSQGSYFICIGIGKIEINNEYYFCISLASPLGKLLYGKKQGTAFTFQGKEFSILHIY